MLPKQLNHEGWMLRLALDLFASIDPKGGRQPLTVPLGCRWYSEALLPSAFLPECQRNSMEESLTHADAFIDHFDIGKGAKLDQILFPDVRHYVAIEVKMKSKLSAIVKKAAYWNYTGHDEASIPKVLKRTVRQVKEFKAFGFYILSSQINLGLFDEYLTESSPYRSPNSGQ
jgi:hypothetical protein